MSGQESKLSRIQNGERPYRANSELIFRKEGQVDEFGWDEETGQIVHALPTEDSLHVGLSGLCCVLNWNTLSKDDFLYLTNNIIELDELRDFLDQRPYNDGPIGWKNGGVAGVVHGYMEKYEAYVNAEGVVSHLPLKLDDLPVRGTIFPVAGQYVLFSIDEEITDPFASANIPGCEFDESKLELYVDRFRFGEIRFDLVGMQYDGQAVECRFAPPLSYGIKVFMLDTEGMLHRVEVAFKIGAD